MPVARLECPLGARSRRSERLAETVLNLGASLRISQRFGLIGASVLRSNGPFRAQDKKVRINSHRSLLPFVLTVVLCACGGGGGDSNSAASTTIRSLDSGASATTNGNLSDAPVVSLRFALSNPPESGLFFEISSDGDSIDDADIVSGSGDSVFLDLFLKPGTEVSPGIYRETIELFACHDENCTSTVNGSPLTYTLRYDVRGPDDYVTATPVALARIEALSSNSNPVAVPLTTSINNPPTEGVTVGTPFIEFGRDSIRSVSVRESAGDQVVDVILESPAEVGVGHYSSSVRYHTCFDAQCRRPVPRSDDVDSHLLRFGLEYLVTGVPIAPSTVIDLDAGDIAWDPVSSRILFSGTEQAMDGTRQYHVGLLDPASGESVQVQSLGFHVDKIALTVGSEHLYLASSNGSEINRLRMADYEIDATAVLDRETQNGRERLFAIRMPEPRHPGTPMLVGTDFVATTSGTFSGVRLVEGSMSLLGHEDSQDLPSGFTVLTWGEDDSTAYALRRVSGQGENGSRVIRFDLDETGPVSSEDLGLIDGEVQFSAPHYFENRLYFLSGRVVHVPTLTDVHGQLPTALEHSAMVVDESRRRVVFARQATDQAPSGFSRLDVYDLDTFALISSRLFEAFVSPQKLILLGDAGLAGLDFAGDVVLIDKVPDND